MIKNTLTFFLLKAFVLLSILFLLDFAIGSTLRHFYFKQESGLLYRTTYSIEKTTAKVLVFGSSRANHHYHTDVFKKRLNLSYYNVGRDGNSILYHQAILNGVLKRYTPQIIILDFSVCDFKLTNGDYDRLSSLLPYYKTHPEVHEIVNFKSKFEKFKLLSSIYPYNSSLITIAVGNSTFNRNRRSDDNGYVALNRTWNFPIQIIENASKYDVDTNKIKIYNSFLKKCISSKIKLYVVNSPRYVKSNRIDYSVFLAKNIAKKYNIAFLDFSNDTLFLNNNRFFQDEDHLNDNGAIVFSNILIDSITKISQNTINK